MKKKFKKKKKRKKRQAMLLSEYRYVLFRYETGISFLPQRNTFSLLLFGIDDILGHALSFLAFPIKIIFTLHLTQFKN